MVQATIEAVAQHLVRNVPNVGKRTILKLCVKAMVLMTNETKAGLGLRKARRAKSSMKLMSQKTMVWMILQTMSSLYFIMMCISTIKMRMHTELGCEMSQNRSKQVFKIDTGVDGDLMPITMFTNLYPKISLETLAKTIDKGITLFAYNTPIKQYGTCSVKVTFKGKQEICKFYVVEHNTTILGVSDSEKLGLVKVNFDVIQSKMVKMVHNISLSEMFKHEMESEYTELFKGIGCMDGEISIKLKEGVIPHVEPIRRVPHAMQEPLKMELDKLCKEGILHKVDISEPIEWLNRFVCVKKSNGKIRLCLCL